MTRDIDTAGANRVKEAWRANRSALAGWLHIPSAFSAEALARLGYGALVIDMQHGPADLTAAVEMVRAIESGGVEPFVRLQSNEPGEIMKLIDLGVTGVIAPLIETVDGAKALAAAVHYPPRGTRSYGPRRPLLRFGQHYWRTASDTLVTLAMIETAKGLENLEAILDVEGLDGVFIGPSDLALALGRSPLGAGSDDVVAEAISEILAAAKRKGRRAGLFCATGEDAVRAVEQGFDLVSLPPDLATLTQAASQTLGRVQAAANRFGSPP